MEFVELTEDEFLEFSLGYPNNSFFQMPLWGKVKKDNGWNSCYVGLKDDNNKVIAATLLLSKSMRLFKTMYYAPRGFLLDYNNFNILEEFTKGIKNYLSNKNALFLKINPYVDYQERDVDGNIVPDTKNDLLINKLKELGYQHNGFYINQDDKVDLEPRWISVLDLDNLTIDDAFKNMRSGTKYGINNARKNSLEIIEGNMDNLFEFKNLMQHTAERREFVDRPLEYYQNMFKIVKEKDLVKVLLVKIHFDELLNTTKKNVDDNNKIIEENKDNPRKEGLVTELKSQNEKFLEKIKFLEDTISEVGNEKIIAGGWYMLYGNEVNYLFGASYKQYMRYNSQYLLQYEMIKYAIDNHYSRFNFYGIDGNFSEDSKDFGLFDFKRGFNAKVHELIGEFDLVIDKSRYSLYRFSFSFYKKIKKIFSK